MVQFNPKGPSQETEGNPASFLGFAGSPVQAPSPTKFAVDNTKALATNANANLVKGFGDLFNLSIKAIDDTYKTAIEGGIKEETRKLDEQFGVTAATNIATAGGDAIPEEVSRSTEQLNSLSRAYASGRIKSSAYWAKANSIVRQMKNRYPSYGDHIDSTVSSITGNNPANALRNSIMRESQELANRENKIDPKEKFITSNYEHIPIDVLQNKDRMTLDEIVLAAAGKRQQMSNIERERAELNLASKKDEVYQKKVFETANKEVNIIQGEVFQSILKGTPNGGNDFLSKIQKGIANPSSYSAQEKTQIVQQFGLLKSQVGAQIRKTIETYPDLTPQQRKDLFDSGMGRMQLMEDGILNNQYGLVFSEMTALKIAQNQTTAHIASQPTLLKLNAIRQVLGEQGVSNYLLKNTDNINQVDWEISQVLKTQVLGGDKSLSTVMEDGKKAGVNDPKFYRNLIDTAVKAVTDPTLNPEIFKGTVKSLFIDNADFLKKMKPDQANNEFLRLSNPTVAKAIYAKKDLEPQLWEGYKKWTLESASKQANRLADNLREIRVNRNSMDIQYNEKTKEFELFDVTEGGDRLPYTPEARALIDGFEAVFANKQQAARTVNEFNKIIKAADSVFSVEGRDTTNFIKKLIFENLDLNADRLEKKGNSMQQLIDWIQGALPQRPATSE